MYLTLLGFAAYFILGPSSIVFAQSFVPRVFDLIDPIDMKRLTSENFLSR